MASRHTPFLAAGATVGLALSEIDGLKLCRSYPGLYEKKLIASSCQEPINMKTNKYLFILTALFTLVLAACGGDGQGEWATYTSDEVGLSFELPDSWAIQEDGESITFANEEALLNADLISDGGGGYVSVEPVESYGGEDDPKRLLDLLVADFTDDGDLAVVEPVAAMDLNGQTAATVTLEGLLDTQPGTFVVVVIIANERLALILGIDGSDEGEYIEPLNRIAESMVIQ